MAKRIIWSPNSLADRIGLLIYWSQRTGNNAYGEKLDSKIRKTVLLLSEYPEMGRKLENREDRFFVKENYQIFYRILESEIHILHIWDSRRNPDNLKID